MALRVVGEEAARGGERPLLADAGEDVEECAALRAGVAHAVGGDGGEVARFGQLLQRLVGGLVRAPAVALDVDDELIAVEDVFERAEPRPWTRIPRDRQKFTMSQTMRK